MEDQTTAGSPATAPGWNPDPYERHELRYWDGAAWTEHVSDHGTTGTDAPQTASPWAAMSQTTVATDTRPAATQPAARAGTALGASSAVGASAVVASTPPSASTTPGPVDAPARPPGPSWDWSAPTPTPASASPTTPSWSTPAPSRAPGPVAFDPSAFGAPARKRGRWYKGRVGRLTLLGIVSLVVILAGYGWLHQPHRIDAAPPAPPPVGYRLITASEFKFAVPESWVSRAVTSDDRDQVAEFLDRQAPGTADQLRDSSEHLDGTQIIAGTPSGAENVNVVPYEALRGNPRDADVIDQIRKGFTSESAGLTTTGLTVVPADVHGFPAATATYTLTLGGRVVAQVSTIIQTGDHVYQLTVTSLSAPTASALSAQILPTFNPV